MRRLYILLCIAALLFGCTGGIEPDGNTGGIVPDKNTGGGDNDGNGEGTISLPSRGSFHLSLTVLLLYRSSGSI